MGAHYDRIQVDRAFRLRMAEQCGIGFDLPSDVPTVPKPCHKKPKSGIVQVPQKQ
jgi:hypothetical protein